MLFSINLKDAYLHIPIVKYHHYFMVCLAAHTFAVEGFAFGLPTAPMALTSLAKSILFLCKCKGFHVKIYLEDILVLTHLTQSVLAIGQESFCAV